MDPSYSEEINVLSHPRDIMIKI